MVISVVRVIWKNVFWGSKCLIAASLQLGPNVTGLWVWEVLLWWKCKHLLLSSLWVASGAEICQDNSRRECWKLNVIRNCRQHWSILIKNAAVELLYLKKMCWRAFSRSLLAVRICWDPVSLRAAVSLKKTFQALHSFVLLAAESVCIAQEQGRETKAKIWISKDLLWVSSFAFADLSGEMVSSGRWARQFIFKSVMSRKLILLHKNSKTLLKKSLSSI